MSSVATTSANTNEQIKLEQEDACAKSNSILAESNNAKIELLKKETKLLNLNDDNEKENDAKQIDTGEINASVTTNNGSINGEKGHEEIIDGFSFLSFEFESDFKVS